MDGFWDQLLGQTMPPHGHCYLWNDSLVYLHVISDAFITLSYFTIPLALVYLVKKRDDLSFNYIFVCFAVFIFACGATHLMAIYNVWHGAYWLSGAIKAITAMASIGTALLVWPLLPRALAIPSNQLLREMNQQLRSESEISRQQRMEVERLTRDLQHVVAERTLELEETRKIKAELEAKNEELRQINTTLEQFAHVAAHDLKEPVRTINAMSEFLRESTTERLNEEEQKWLGYISSASERLGKLISDLHAYTFVTHSDENFEPLDLEQMVDNAIEDLQVSIEEYQVQINREPLPRIHGNATQIQQLLFNLINNAIKFSRNSRPPVIDIGPLTTDLSEETGFYVKDNGIGIAQEYKDKIFGIFERVHTDEGYEGSGIGLAICKKVLDRHHGRAEVHSVLGEGTEFRIYFEPVLVA